MKLKFSQNFKKHLIISYVCCTGFAGVVALALAWRDSWTISDVTTYFCDIFFIAAILLIFVYVLILLSRAGYFAQFGYFAHKREARKNNKVPKYRTYREYIDNRPKSNFDAKLILFPGLTFLVIAVIFMFFAI